MSIDSQFAPCRSAGNPTPRWEPSDSRHPAGEAGVGTGVGVTLARDDAEKSALQLS
jgi:hypothetical protein